MTEGHTAAVRPRLTTVLSVARGVLAAVGPRVGTPALVAEYGWDVTFQALALLRQDDAREAFGIAWTMLLVDPLAEELDQHAQDVAPDA